MSKESFIDFTIRVMDDDPSDFQTKNMDRDMKQYAQKCLGSTCWEYKTFSIFVDPCDHIDEDEYE